MGFLLSGLFSMLGSLPGVLGRFFSAQSEIANANIQLQKEIVKAQILQAGEMAKAQLQFQTTALHSTMPLFKQHMFWFLSIPILITMFMPNYAQVLWNNVRLIPEFYWTLYSAVVLTIWGIPVASGIVSNIFGGFTSFAADRRADKIQMLSVSSEQYKKAFADMYRLKNGPISQKDWNALEKTLDAMGEPSMDKIR